MKNFGLLFFIALVWSCNSPENKFVLEGNIEGLKKGDTILITEYLLPMWEEAWTDTVLVGNFENFYYKKELEHTSHILVDYKPKDREALASPIRGIMLFARNKDRIVLDGSTDYIGASHKTGGIYTDSLVQRMTVLENEYHTQLTDIYRKLDDARENEDRDSMKIYSDMYNQHSLPQEAKDIEKYFTYEVNDNEYAAYLYLQGLYDEDYKKIEKRFEEFTPEVQTSYMGTLVGNMAKALKNIGLGNQPNNFTVTDNEGRKVQLSDYQGKYVLIYHWGLCPGTIWVHPFLLSLYDEYKDKGFDIIGFTAGDFAEMYPDFVNNENARETVDLLSNQPWTTVYTEQEGNEFIKEELYFIGVPILMLVSPDGTTLVRGYSDVYEDVKKILEENLIQ